MVSLAVLGGTRSFAVAKPPNAAGTSRWAIRGVRAEAGLIGHGDQKVEIRLRLDLVQQLDREVFRIGQHQGLPRFGAEDVGGQPEELQPRLWPCVRRCRCKQTGWLVSASSTKKVCATLVGRAASSWRWGAHVVLAEAAYAMRIDGQDPALKIARSEVHLAQGQLQAFAVDHASGREQLVDGHIGGKEWQAIGQLKTCWFRLRRSRKPVVQRAAS